MFNKKIRISKILEILNTNLFEREEAIALTFLAAMSGESIFLIGKPGVAKSMISRRMKEVFKGGTAFEYLMNRFSTPEEIFGPISIKKLKDEDKYERNTQKYLPNADIVFLDEIWKAGPSIQNTLLTVINEKIFKNGEDEMKLPLKLLVSASNELPAKDEGLEALWDRFIIRLNVESIDNDDNFVKFLSTNFNENNFKIPEKLKITNEEFENWQTEIDKITIPKEIFKIIKTIKIKLNEIGDKETTIEISDRRWKKIIKILKTSAFLNDRKGINLADCYLISHCIWNEMEQINIVKREILQTLQNHSFLQDDFKNLDIELKDLELKIYDKTHETVIEKYKALKEISIENRIYYKIFKDGDEYYLLKNDYKILDENDFKEISILVKNQNYFQPKFNKNHYFLKKIKDDKLLIKLMKWYYDADECSIATETKFRDKVKDKEPEEKDIKNWKKKVSAIETEADELLKKIEDYRKANLDGIKNHLFVQERILNYVDIALNHEQVELENKKSTAKNLLIPYAKV